jgi:two-component system, OmpR family, sensor kinase
MTRAPTTSLFLQALGLVGATLLAVFAAATLVIFNIPAPAPEIYKVTDVVQALRTGKTVATSEGRALEVRMRDQPPTGVSFGRRHIDFRAGLAQVLKIDPNNIVVVQNQPPVIAIGGPPRPPRRPAPPPTAAPDRAEMFGAFQAAVRQPDGRWLTVSPHKALIEPWQERVLIVIAAAAIAVTPIAWWFARRLAAPISAFARAAERLGRDPEAPPLDIRGSTEVSAAVAAFNVMQQRLKRYVTYRTTMIGAIAHDLRTPLTRLRFRIEAAPDDLRAKLASDIDEMEAMVSATLAFVQDTTRPTNRTKLELSSLVETVMDEAAETGADASVEWVERTVVDGDPIALKRLVTNLVDNALKFGSRAKGRVYGEAGMAIIEIEDNGPGVPEGEFERAFEPFHRLENSRSRETGGAGLGLAVVRAIARGHGGEVTLQNRAEGGLRAKVNLPLAPRGGGAVLATTSPPIEFAEPRLSSSPT